MPQPKEPSINIVQLAELLGLSKSTVHAALTGRSNISAVTQERVLAAAKVHGYQPNLMARHLRTKRSGLIGIIHPSPFNELSSGFMKSVSTDLRLAGYQMLFSSSFYQPNLEQDLIQLYRDLGVEGILLFPTMAPENLPLYTELAHCLPLVWHNAPSSLFPVDVVNPDDRRTGSCATEHLVRMGCRRIAFLPPPSPQYPDKYFWASLRERGYVDAMETAGLPPLLIPPPVGEYMRDPVDDHFPFAQQAMKEFLADGGQLDGLFAANDQLAYGAIAALRAAGMRVPEDVAVIGCDDLQMSKTIDPPLSTMRPPMSELGSEAIRLLLLRIKREHPDLPRQQVLLPSTLVARASSERAHE